MSKPRQRLQTKVVAAMMALLEWLFPISGEFCQSPCHLDSQFHNGTGILGWRHSHKHFCTHFVVNDARWLHEYKITAATTAAATPAMMLENPYRLRGFGGDCEGICFYQDANDMMKLAVIDKENRSAALCNLPDDVNDDDDNEIDFGK